jgi:hypothetical protein
MVTIVALEMQEPLILVAVEVVEEVAEQVAQAALV